VRNRAEATPAVGACVARKTARVRHISPKNCAIVFGMVWFFLGCDPDTKDVLVVIRGSHVGIVDSIEAHDYPHTKQAGR